VGDVLDVNRGFQWNGVVCGMAVGMSFVIKLPQEVVNDVMNVGTLNGTKLAKNTKRSCLNGVKPIVANGNYNRSGVNYKLTFKYK
jgi:hypothetical protein